MPELPEVETVCRGLEPHIQGKKIVKAHTYRENLRYPFPEDFTKKLTGRTVQKINRRSKYIEIHLDNDDVWITHLGMTGIYLLCETDDYIKKHTHLHIDFDDISLRYLDPRRFGYMDIIHKDDLATSSYYKNLGPEPFSSEFSNEHIQQKLEKSKKPIKTLLMDNNFVVGVGNIYANEILFALNISPLTPANQLKNSYNKHNISNYFRFIHQFRKQITDTLQAAIEAGGSTISDFKAPDSTSGYFPMDFKVYGKENKPCPKCNCQIKRIQQAGRSTFYCPKCQK